VIHIRPAHHAILCYAEWCCDNGRPWPKWFQIAEDLARDERDLRAAFSQLEEWGLVSARYSDNGHLRIVRLGDGRETAPTAFGPSLVKTPAIHSQECSVDVLPTATKRRKVA
jgi:hypothetical protein